jgi:hypothetical protein
MNVLERNTNPQITSLVSFITVLFFLPLLLFATYQSVILITRAVGTPANVLVDTKAVLEPIKTDFYHAFAQGGEESEDMIGPVLSETRALNPKLIRIDHIYDYYNVVGGSGGGMSFDFSRLDAAVNTILGAGAKPLLSLSYMPPSIAKGGAVINPPNDWNDWATVVAKTIEHYSGKGEKNLGGVYYEVWNEPDLGSFGSWKLSGEKNYLTLYQYAAEGAKRAANTNWFYLGGPATTGLYKNWIMALAGSGYRTDFFSWHSYLADPKRFTTDQENFITWMLPYPWHTLKPTLITEFGFTGDKSSLYNSTYAAAYTAAVIRQMISGGPSYLFSFEIKDGPGQSNGWGLVAHQNAGKKPKPRYWVYSFIDQMVGNRLQVTGEGTWVTGFASKNEKTIRLFLVNFDRSGSHVETVPIKFTNLDPGTYTLREHFLFGTDTSSEKAIPEGVYEEKLYMGSQSVVILELTKKD